MEVLDSNYCVRLFNVFEDDDSVQLSLELCLGGDLFSRIHSGQYGREDSAVCTMRQILCGVEHLASFDLIIDRGDCET